MQTGSTGNTQANKLTMLLTYLSSVLDHYIIFTTWLVEAGVRFNVCTYNSGQY